MYANILPMCGVRFWWALVCEGATSSFPHQCSKRTDVREQFREKKENSFANVENLRLFITSVGVRQSVNSKVISVFRFCARIDRELVETPTIPSCASLPPF